MMLPDKQWWSVGLGVLKHIAGFVRELQAERKSRLETKKLEHDLQESRIAPVQFNEIIKYDPKTKAVMKRAGDENR